MPILTAFALLIVRHSHLYELHDRLRYRFTPRMTTLPYANVPKTLPKLRCRF